MTSGEDLILRLAVGSALVLVLVTILFMLYALVLHIRGIRITRRREELEARWRERLLAAATGDTPLDTPPDPGTVGKASIEIDPKDQILFLELVTAYARALRGPERRQLEHVAGPYLGALDPMLDDPDPYRRAYGLDLLGELGFEAARDRIVRGLHDESGLVAMVAARALARHADPAHVPLLIQRLDAFENWSTSYLANLLRSFGPGAAPALRTLAMNRSTTGQFRCIALQALRDLNDLESVGPAAAALSQESDPEVQAGLIRILGTLGRPEHLDQIRPFARDARSEDHVRAAAIQAVGTLSDQRASDVAMVSDALDDPSPWVALQAARGLLALGREAELAELARSSSPRANLAAEVLEGAR